MNCPKCASVLVAERGAEPWCPRCEWGLDTFEPDRRSRELTFRWQDRRAFRAAYRLNAAQFRALAGNAVARPGLDAARIALCAISLLMLAVAVGLAVGGVDLVRYGSPVVGVVMIAVALVLYPRFERMPKRAKPVPRESAPALHALIDEVAAAVGARRPQLVYLSSAYNAWAAAVGWRRRRVLSIGLPLWVSLPPQQRVALLGHELGHFVNGDVRCGALTSFGQVTLARMTLLTQPGRYRTGSVSRGHGFAGAGMVLAPLLYPVFALVNCMVAGLTIGVVWIGRRSSSRAEYYADATAARVAGSRAVVGVMDALLLGDSILRMVRRAARQDGSPGAWLAAAQGVREEFADRLPSLRQLTIRDGASLFATHPPSGLRIRMIESRAGEAGTVILGGSRAAQIDAELAGAYRELRQDLAAR